jgi:hypothetical protein
MPPQFRNPLAVVVRPPRPEAAEAMRHAPGGALSAEPLRAWAERSAGGDARLAAVLMGCAARFRMRFSCVTVFPPAGTGARALLRLWRAAAVVAADGTVRSAELFRVRDPAAFLSGAEFRAALAAAAWDDRACVFAEAPPPRRTREEPPLMDWAGAACLAALPDMIRQFEYLLNADLRLDGKVGLILREVPGGWNGVAPHRPMRDDVRDAFADALRETVAAEAPAALEAFRAALDGAKLQALGKAAANSVGAYNWLCGRVSTRVDAALGERRTQAASAFPFAWSLLSAAHGPVAEAVGEARPLIPVLAAALGVAPSAVKRMNGLPSEAAGHTSPPTPDAVAGVARRVEAMPPGAAPKTAAGWRGFFAATALSKAVDRHGALADDGGPAGVAALLKTAGRWDALDGAALAHAAGGFADMIADFNANVGEPMAALAGVLRKWSARRAVERLVRGRDVAQIAEATAWWHEHQADIRLRLSTMWPTAREAAGPQSWPPLHAGGVWFAANGLELVPLTDERMLVEEHERMGHCVNQYSPRCLFEGCHILSVRAEGGAVSLGTAEFRQDALLAVAKTRDDPPDAPLTQLPPAVVQFRSARNGCPETRAWEALWDYVSAVMTGRLELDAETLEKEQWARRAAGRGRVKQSTCYDAVTEEAVVEAWKLYAPMLPKSLSKKGPTALVADL